MNLKAIKERCNSIPIENHTVDVLIFSDIPALLAWVSRAARLFERIDMESPTSHSEKVAALLAELEDAEIKGKGD